MTTNPPSKKTLSQNFLFSACARIFFKWNVRLGPPFAHGQGMHSIFETLRTGRNLAPFRGALAALLLAVPGVKIFVCSLWTFAREVMNGKKLIRLLCLVCVATMPVGCAMDVANRYYGTVRYPAKDPSQVKILSREPGRPYHVIADFQSRWDTAESVRAKAANIGADAVIISTPGGSYYTGEEWAVSDSFRGSSPRICGTAIIYKKQ